MQTWLPAPRNVLSFLPALALAILGGGSAAWAAPPDECVIPSQIDGDFDSSIGLSVGSACPPGGSCAPSGAGSASSRPDRTWVTVIGKHVQLRRRWSGVVTSVEFDVARVSCADATHFELDADSAVLSGPEGRSTMGPVHLRFWGSPGDVRLSTGARGSTGSPGELENIAYCLPSICKLAPDAQWSGMQRFANGKPLAPVDAATDREEARKTREAAREAERREAAERAAREQQRAADEAKARAAEQERARAELRRAQLASLFKKPPAQVSRGDPTTRANCLQGDPASCDKLRTPEERRQHQADLDRVAECHQRAQQAFEACHHTRNQCYLACSAQQTQCWQSRCSALKQQAEQNPLETFHYQSCLDSCGTEQCMSGCPPCAPAISCGPKEGQTRIP